MIFIEQFHYHINRRHCHCLRCSSSRPCSRTFCCFHFFLHKFSSKTNQFSTIFYLYCNSKSWRGTKTPILLRSRICRLETLVNLTSRTQGIGMGTQTLSEGQILQFSTTTKHHYRDNFWSWSILFNQIWKKPYKASYIFAILLFFLSDIIFLVLIFGMFWNWSKAKGQPQDKSRFILEVKQ